MELLGATLDLRYLREHFYGDNAIRKKKHGRCELMATMSVVLYVDNLDHDHQIIKA